MLGRVQIDWKDGDGEVSSVIKQSEGNVGFLLGQALGASGLPRNCRVIADAIDYLADVGEFVALDPRYGSIIMRLVQAAREIQVYWDEHDEKYGVTAD